MTAWAGSRLLIAASASEQVYAILFDLIMAFRLKPFALISEKAVADVLRISRSPVREALARLSNVGLVDIYKQRGTVVAPLRVVDLQRSQFLRECVEVGLLRKACALPDRTEVSRGLRGEIALQEALASIEDHRRFARSDELFHQHLAAAAGMAGIWLDIGTAKVHMDRFRMLTFPDLDSLTTIISQHRAMAEAIDRGDEIGAIEVMQVHLRKIFPLVPSLVQRFPEYFESGGGPDVHRPDLDSLLLEPARDAEGSLDHGGQGTSVPR